MLPSALPSALLAAGAPSLLAFNVSPSPTFLNQALAFALWALFVVVSAAPAQTGSSSPWRATLTLQAALALLALSAAWAMGSAALPASLALCLLRILLPRLSYFLK